MRYAEDSVDNTHIKETKSSLTEGFIGNQEEQTKLQWFKRQTHNEWFSVRRTSQYANYKLV